MIGSETAKNCPAPAKTTMLMITVAVKEIPLSTERIPNAMPRGIYPIRTGSVYKNTFFIIAKPLNILKKSYCNY